MNWLQNGAGLVFTLAQDKKVEASFFMKVVEQSIWIGIGAAIALVAQWHGSISQVVTMMLAVVITIAAASVPLVWRQGRAQRRALSAMSAPSTRSDDYAASA